MGSVSETGIEQRLLDLLRTLPSERVTEVLDFVEFLHEREKSRANGLQLAIENSFGVWRDRPDLSEDSVTLICRVRDEWQAREDRLGRE